MSAFNLLQFTVMDCVQAFIFNNSFYMDLYFDLIFERRGI